MRWHPGVSAQEEGTAVDVSARARAEFEEVQDDPRARLAFARRFYREDVEGKAHNYGNSERAFMKWEVQRGVLNPRSGSAADPPGSPWWREVNGGLLVDAQEAYLRRHEQIEGGRVSLGVSAWLRFVDEPSATNWYRAHNTSIVLGYLAHAGLARDELGWEQKLMNIVLYRVLFTQAVVDRQPWALGILIHLFGGLFDPRGSMVSRVIHNRSLYPASYPLDADDRRRLERRMNHFDDMIGAAVDIVFIRSRLDRLFRYMADDLGVPELIQLCPGLLPSYPWCLSLADNELVAISLNDHPGLPARTLGRFVDLLLP
jgi:hypothetical protein